MSEENRKVIAIDGSEYLKSDCRKIKGEYYKIGDINVEESGHCYLIDGKYYKHHTGYIVFDHRVKQYVLKRSMELLIENGVVSLNKDTPVFGSFSRESMSSDIFLVYKGNKYACLNEDIFDGSIYFQECLKDGCYYLRQDKRSVEFITPAPCDQNFKNSLHYDSKNISFNHKALYDKLYVPKYSENIDKYGDFVKNYTFGLEFETSSGMVPDRITSRLGLIPLRDGSISGLEFVTVPLGGKKGIQTIMDICKELSKRTTYNNDCSFHIHIGGVPRTEAFFLSLFRVLCSIEEEMYSMFPIYKRQNFGIKRKCYTRPLPSVELLSQMDGKITKSNLISNFDILYTYLSTGTSFSEYGNSLAKVLSHPSDPQGNGKWNIRTRYHWVNLIPLLFGNKQTIEFRVHTPTLDYNKIIQFLFICISIIDFAITKEKQILEDPKKWGNVDLHNILYNFTITNGIPEIILDSVHDYIASRKDYIAHETQKGNIVAYEDNFKYKSFFGWGPTTDYSKGFKKSRRGNPYIQGHLNELQFFNPQGNWAQPPDPVAVVDMADPAIIEHDF